MIERISHYLYICWLSISYCSILEGHLPGSLFLKTFIIRQISFQLREAFSFGEIEAFDVNDYRDEVDEEEADDSPIDIDDIANTDFEDANQEADTDHQCDINYLGNINFPFFRLGESEYAEGPLPLYFQPYLLISKN